MRLAERGRGRVSPNPLVGAVVVQDGRIIAQGYHGAFGQEHAEIRAFRNAAESVSGATLYVNLEPCSHYGKQPPCVDEILRRGVGKVVVGTPDPNPRVHGEGIARLRERGVEVRVGVLQDACEALNEAYFKHIVTGLPFTTVKIAQTLDGKIATATGESQWITGERARREGHRLRSKNGVVLVGIGTILADDPQLTVRLTEGVNPTRVILDSRLRIPPSARVLRDRPELTIIATTEQSSREKREAIEAAGARVWVVPEDNGRVSLTALWRKLGDAGFKAVLVEGGGGVYSALVRERLVDRLAIFVAPKVLGHGLAALADVGVRHLDQALRLTQVEYKRLGDDFYITGILQGSES